jgi:hypothetical protein
MTAADYGYFDEAYFQDGQKRGTAYVNYKEGAPANPTFRELALAVRDVFQPRRVLEIGCATGVVVRHLNELGCEAHGIDVSEWAVRNAEHPNVRLASADQLPYPDNHFDLVLSCHSLEHLPEAVFEGSLAELARVGSAYQFHMLPIVGQPPYDGEPATVRQNLRKDPTHQQLHELEWWLEQFGKVGQVPVETSVLFKHDTPGGELSTCQFILQANSGDNPIGVLRRSRMRNQRIFRSVQLAGPKPAGTQAGIKGMGQLSYRQRIWKDVDRQLGDGETLNLQDKFFELVIIVNGPACNLRFAAGQDVERRAYAHVGELHMVAQPGCNMVRFTVDQLKTLRGQPDYSKINHLALGGENENAEIVFYFGDQHGTPVLD